ncbi:dihydrodipicolinate synthase family protein [Hespellia stercorisuis]|uniref:N-acetylneuraminate lyase n=1 Tax=Hespellia stercorisuis DSM 15480 TaxID=1121950 RepID=A0A1M6K7Z7_9FIRM|nr:dihydrodipicolinate synthase family protein [Hespellia stercorisuis]SHJ54987.1 N-acetylneuraminate lyase [Hespellia stercorisuis DSM 15480]
MNTIKYQGIIPAFYACYDEAGNVDSERTKKLAGHLLRKGVRGLYVNGSSGECIYQSVEERKQTLEAVMSEVGGAMTVIAHVACNNTADSMELAAHAESLNVDAIASIPPIYFKLPESEIAKYWNDISSAAPNTDFIIYNIPQLAGVSLTMPLFEEMKKNPRVVGVKNSSMPVQDIQMFKDAGGSEFVVFNGPDEQLTGGLAIGADGGIGGTYAVMPEAYLKIYSLVKSGNVAEAARLQNQVNRIIYAMCACEGNLYAVMKEILRQREGCDIGSVRAPLLGITEADREQIAHCIRMIDEVVA